MATIDELVTMLRYEVASGTESAIERFQRGLDDVGGKVGSLGKSFDRTERSERTIDKTTRMLNASWDKTAKGINAAKRATAGLTTGFKTLGVVSMVTSGVMAAWGVNAAKNASQLNKTSYSLQLSTDQVQEMGGVYEELGGTLQDFANDAANYRAKTGKAFDLDAMKVVADEMRGMTESQALFWGQAQGFTDTGIRAMHEYINSIEEIVNKKRGLGHFADPKDIENLGKFDVAWKNLSNTVSGLSASFQAGMSAGGATSALDVLGEALSKNTNAFKDWGDAIGNTIGNLIDGAVADFGRLNTLLGKERTPEAIAVMTSSDENVRKENLKRLQTERDQKAAGNKAALVINIGKAIFTEATISDAIDTYHASQEIIDKPLETAKHFDLIASRGQHAPAIDALAEGLIDEWRNMDGWKNRLIPPQMKRKEAEEFAYRIVVEKEMLPQWLMLDADTRSEVSEKAFRQGAGDESIYDQIRDPASFAKTINNQTPTAEQRSVNAAVAKVSEFSSQDLHPESEMDKEYFRPEQVAEEMREKPNPVPASSLFGNVSPNVRVQFDPALMPAMPSHSLRLPQSPRPELSRNTDGSVTVQHASITINAPTGDGNDIYDSFGGNIRNIRNAVTPTTAFAEGR